MMEKIELFDRPERGETDWQGTRYVIGYRDLEAEVEYWVDKDGDFHFFIEENELANFLVSILNLQYNTTFATKQDWASDGNWCDATATSGDGLYTFYHLDSFVRCLAEDLDNELESEEYNWEQELFDLLIEPDTKRWRTVTMTYREG